MLIGHLGIVLFGHLARVPHPSVYNVVRDANCLLERPMDTAVARFGLEGKPLVGEPRALVSAKPWIRFIAIFIDLLE